MNQETIQELRARLLADEQIRSMIAMRAYEIFEFRGGSPGHEAEDWFQAETEILTIVIDEEVRQSSAQSSLEEPASHGREVSPQGTTEKRMEVFAVVETEAVLSSQPAAHAELAGGEVAGKRNATQEKTKSREASRKSSSKSKKDTAGLKPPKASDKKSSTKVKLIKKAGKTKQSKHRSAEMEKEN